MSVMSRLLFGWRCVWDIWMRLRLVVGLCGRVFMMNDSVLGKMLVMGLLRFVVRWWMN